MKLALVIASLNAGGAERVASTLANAWTSASHSVSVITQCGADHVPFYKLVDPVALITLGGGAAGSSTASAARTALARVRELRKALKATSPEVVISFMDSANIIAAAACKGLPGAVIATEHCAPSVSAGSGLWNRARRWSYRRASVVVVPTAAAELYHRERGLRNVRHIPHPLIVEDARPSDECRWPPPFLLAMGRLVPEKGFDVLIRAFGRLSREHPEWRLVILGEGPLRSDLEALVSSLGLGQQVELPGLVQRPRAVLEAAAVFAFSSRIESFGMALCEAMACGRAVVAADCPVGPREIVTDGVNGLLVPPEDEVALAGAIGQLMNEPERRARLGNAARGVAERFSLQRVLQEWDRLFETAAGARG